MVIIKFLPLPVSHNILSSQISWYTSPSRHAIFGPWRQRPLATARDSLLPYKGNNGGQGSCYLYFRMINYIKSKIFIILRNLAIFTDAGVYYMINLLFQLLQQGTKSYIREIYTISKIMLYIQHCKLIQNQIKKISNFMKHSQLV